MEKPSPTTDSPFRPPLAGSSSGAAVGTLRALAATAGVVFCHAIALIVFAGFLLSMEPSCERMLHDFGAKVPDITILAIELSRWIASYWYLLPILLLADAGAYFALARLGPGWRWLATFWAMAIMVFAMLMFALVAVGLISPIVKLYQAISKT